MIASEIMAAFHDFWSKTDWGRPENADYPSAYPLYVATSTHAGTWYVRERMPGTRIWRAEEDGRFALLDVFDTPTRLAPPVSLIGCAERDW